MISIYGSPVSNYYNTVLASLHYKAIPFREIHLSAAEDEDILRKSPMGKIPYIHDMQNYLSETTVILEYLEEKFPASNLYPQDVLQRGRVRQLIKFIELYVDAPARKLFPGVFWFESNHSLHVEEVKPLMEKGLSAVDALVNRRAQYLMGDTVSYADFYAYFSFHVANQVTESQYGWSFLSERPEIRQSFEQLEQLKFMKKITKQRDASMELYLENKAKTPSKTFPQ